MVTKHFKKLQAAQLVWDANTGATITLVDGSTSTLYGYGSSAGDFTGSFGSALCSPKGNPSNMNSAGVYFGTGTTQPTENDYKLSGSFVKGIQVSLTPKPTSDENGLSSSTIYTITNGNSSAITISEIGCVVSLYKNGSSSAGYALAERTVLTNPLTIEPNGVGQVVYTVRYEW